VKVTVAGDGTDAGAVYVAAPEVTLVSDPQVAPEQPDPERLHVTPLFWRSFCSAAEKPALCETCTDEELGLTETVIGCADVVTVMVAEDDLLVSATDLAVSVTVAGEGAEAGALYVADVAVTFVSAPQLAPEHPAPETLHVTPLFCVSPCNVAVKAA